MTSIEVTEDAPDVDPGRLWSLVGDLDAWADLLPTMTAVTRQAPGGDVGVGSRYDVRQPGLPPAVYEVSEWTPGRSFTWVARSPGVVSTARHVVEPVPGGSRLHLALDWTGPLAGVVRLLVGQKARRMVETEARTFVELARRP